MGLWNLPWGQLEEGEPFLPQTGLQLCKSRVQGLSCKKTPIGALWSFSEFGRPACGFPASKAVIPGSKLRFPLFAHRLFPTSFLQSHTIHRPPNNRFVAPSIHPTPLSVAKPILSQTRTGASFHGGSDSIYLTTRKIQCLP